MLLPSFPLISRNFSISVWDSEYLLHKMERSQLGSYQSEYTNLGMFAKVESDPKKFKTCDGTNSPSVKDRGPANHLSYGWFALKGNSIARYSNVFSASTEWYSNVLCNNTLRFGLREYSSTPPLTTDPLLCSKIRQQRENSYRVSFWNPCYPHMK